MDGRREGRKEERKKKRVVGIEERRMKNIRRD